MSNRQVPIIYRTIIDDVIEKVRPDFDEVGIEEAVLAELLRSWEDKVATSRVADFTSDPKMSERAKQFPMLPVSSSKPERPSNRVNS
jgi:transcription initiation factor TFIIA large subunit